MQLPGRLARTTLGDLLGSLHRAGQSGTLELRARGRRHRIHLQRGFVAGVDLDVETPPARLGDVLAAEGVASRARIDDVLRRHAQAGEVLPQGELLVRAGVLTSEVRDAALRKQARVRLDALFALLDDVPGPQRDAEVRFVVGPSAGRPRAKASPLSPLEFLHGRPRARDAATADERRHEPRESLPSRPPALERLRALRLLGVAPGADPATIRRAFRNAAARVHPDRHQSLPANERARLHAALAELSAAYHLLCA